MTGSPSGGTEPCLCPERRRLFAGAEQGYRRTYILISASRRVVATGEETDAYGRHPKGMIMYGKDGRMLVTPGDHTGEAQRRCSESIACDDAPRSCLKPLPVGVRCRATLAHRLRIACTEKETEC